MTNDQHRPPLTNAEKQAAFRERRKAEAEARERELWTLRGNLADEQATSAGLRRQLEALAEVIANQRDASALGLLYEVIASKPRGTAYGVTFADPDEANSYAEAMRSAGYSVDHYEPFLTARNARAGLAEAADFFKDAALAAERKAE